MAVAFFASVWNALSSSADIGGVQLEVQFFHFAFLLGGGVVTFVFFGFEKRLTSPVVGYGRRIVSRVRRYLYGTFPRGGVLALNHTHTHTHTHRE